MSFQSRLTKTEQNLRLAGLEAMAAITVALKNGLGVRERQRLEGAFGKLETSIKASQDRGRGIGNGD